MNQSQCVNGQNARRTLLDLFACAAEPLTSTQAARELGLDLISTAANVSQLAYEGKLVRVNRRMPARYRAQAALALPNPLRPPAGSHTPFGLVCGGAS